MPDGSLGTGRALPGRGAWLCRGSPACLERAARRGALERALRARLAPTAVEELARQIGTAGDVPARQIGTAGDVPARQIGTAGDVLARQIGTAGDVRGWKDARAPRGDA